MQEFLKLIISNIHGMWRYRWYALLLAWIVSVSIWVFAYIQPNEYQGTARVYIDTETVLQPLLSGLAIQSDVMVEVNLMSKALLSRPSLEKIVRETDLDHRAKTPHEMEELLDTLRWKIKMHEEGPRSNLFRITYKDVDREMARKVVQTLLNSLIENALGANRTDTTNAQRFLIKQIGEYEARLAEAEQRVAEFKQKNVGMMPSEGRDYYARLQKSLEGLENIKSKLKMAQNRRSELRRQLEGEEPAFFGFSGPASQNASSEYNIRIEEQQAQLDNALLRYTEKHPDVIALQEMIKHLKARREEALQSGEGIASNLRESPAFQRMKNALSEAEVDYAITKGQADEQQRKVDRLKKLVDIIPEVEAELIRLNRDYEVTKLQYETLLQRLESARLSEEVEKSSDDVEFRIIDPVNVPLKPIGPARTLYLTMGLIAGLSAGLGLAFLLTQIRPTFYDREALGKIFQFPVFGTISMVLTPRQRSRLQLGVFSFMIVTFMLVIALGGTIIFQDSGARFMQLLINKGAA